MHLVVGMSSLESVSKVETNKARYACKQTMVSTAQFGPDRTWPDRWQRRLCRVKTSAPTANMCVDCRRCRILWKKNMKQGLRLTK